MVSVQAIFVLDLEPRTAGVYKLSLASAQLAAIRGLISLAACNMSHGYTVLISSITRLCNLSHHDIDDKDGINIQKGDNHDYYHHPSNHVLY